MAADSHGESRNVWEHWVRHAERTPDREAVVHWTAGEEPYRWTWAALVAEAARYAARLRALGVAPGQVCALIVRHHRDFYPLYLGIEALGALPAVLAYPNPRLHPDKFRHGLEGMSRTSGLDWILTERELEPMVGPLVSREGSVIRGVLFPLEGASDPPAARLPAAAGPDEPCLLQHSSGTTGLQKAVVLSHGAILEHVRRYGEAVRLRDDDRIVSWLPLYHDMGLIACFYVALVSGVPLVQLDPFEWVLAPGILLDCISRERGTLAWLPNFAYNLLADRVHEEDLEGVRLDSLRMVVNCSEPVRASSHRKFLDRFAPYGLRREALAACYAMAETTYAVTQTEPAVEARIIVVDRDALARGEARPPVEGRPVRDCVSSGAPISGCDLKVVDEVGGELPDDRAGELVIRSVSMFDGYRNQPAKTDEVLKDGWYWSGDLGFRRDGEYYVIGRKKDIVIVAGKNIYPEDVEDAVGQVEGILPGRVVVFGAEDEATGTEEIAVVAETEIDDHAGRKRLKLAIVEAGMASDVTIGRVYLVPPRWMIKSSAGKPSRRANRERALGELTPVGKETA
jgi:acyl-CoA synthetase (AMP-forming)/AMP-acid ligase II